MAGTVGAVHVIVLDMPRKTTGYSLYAAQAKDRVETNLKEDLRKGDKVRAADLSSAVERRWNNLPQASRNIWDGRAAKN